MVFKLAGDADARLGLPGAHLFEPMQGRPMREWAEVPAEAPPRGRSWAGRRWATWAAPGARPVRVVAIHGPGT
jgi:hypothetical protein